VIVFFVGAVPPLVERLPVFGETEPVLVADSVAVRCSISVAFRVATAPVSVRV
jgi:hypothetical protein